MAVPKACGLTVRVWSLPLLEASQRFATLTTPPSRRYATPFGPNRHNIYPTPRSAHARAAHLPLPGVVLAAPAQKPHRPASPTRMRGGAEPPCGGRRRRRDGKGGAWRRRLLPPSRLGGWGRAGPGELELGPGPGRRRRDDDGVFRGELLGRGAPRTVPAAKRVGERGGQAGCPPPRQAGLRGCPGDGGRAWRAGRARGRRVPAGSAAGRAAPSRAVPSSSSYRARGLPGGAGGPCGRPRAAATAPASVLAGGSGQYPGGGAGCASIRSLPLYRRVRRDGGQRAALCVTRFVTALRLCT